MAVLSKIINNIKRSGGIFGEGARSTSSSGSIGSKRWRDRYSNEQPPERMRWGSSPPTYEDVDPVSSENVIGILATLTQKVVGVTKAIAAQLPFIQTTAEKVSEIVELLAKNAFDNQKKDDDNSNKKREDDLKPSKILFGSIDKLKEHKTDFFWSTIIGLIIGLTTAFIVYYKKIEEWLANLRDKIIEKIKETVDGILALPGKLYDRLVEWLQHLPFFAGEGHDNQRHNPLDDSRKPLSYEQKANLDKLDDSLQKAGITNLQERTNIEGQIRGENKKNPYDPTTVEDLKNYSAQKILDKYGRNSPFRNPNSPVLVDNLDDAMTYVTQNRASDGKKLGDDVYKKIGGFKYRGRGIIQLTGIDNYRAVSNYMKKHNIADIDLVSKPELAATPEYAYDIAAAWVAMNKEQGKFKNLADPNENILGHGEGKKRQQYNIGAVEYIRDLRRMEDTPGVFDVVKAQPLKATPPPEGGDKQSVVFINNSPTNVTAPKPQERLTAPLNQIIVDGSVNDYKYIFYNAIGG